ncbi:hypothetical protein AB0F11_30335 [Streptomyces sp. NPDC032472]|uniref:hypothetical protein n=1 Tax=Streptomyces sp. NPDC032472 TaxID=3155018 RepID=UPI00340E22D3
MEASHPLFGKVTLQQPDTETAGASTLALTPGGLQEAWIQPMTITFEKSGETAGPFTFEALQPGRWTAHHASFPPPAQETNEDGSPQGGTLYTLQQPISFGPSAAYPAPNTPDTSTNALTAPLPNNDNAYLKLQALDIRQGK